MLVSMLSLVKVRAALESTSPVGMIVLVVGSAVSIGCSADEMASAVDESPTVVKSAIVVDGTEVRTEVTSEETSAEEVGNTSDAVMLV